MIRWLLGLDGLDLADPSVRFGWSLAVPGWGWALVAVGAATLAWLSYRRLAGPSAARWLLAGTRTALLVVLFMLLAGPMLTRPNERTEEDWIVVLADRSRSMTIGDGAAGRTREAALRAAIDSAAPALRDLAAERGLLTMGFAGGVFPIDLLGERTPGTGPDLGSPEGTRTFLGGSLDAALDQVAAKPVAGVVVFSDGASADTVSRRAMRRLRAERIPVHVLPLGSATPASDLAVARVDAPSAAFVRDAVPVTAHIDLLGAGSTPDAFVELIDESTDRVLDRQPVVWSDGSPSARVVLSAKPEDAGEAEWQVRLVTDAADVLAENNTAPLRIELVDRPLRVLHADGYPRWEFRYIKNLLLREPSIESGSLLLSTGRRSIEEGSIRLGRMPASPGEWESFDVIVLGDVRAEMLSVAQMEQIRDHVATRGAGLLWIAGPNATPMSWRGTPLEPLIPISLRGGIPAWPEPVTMHRENAAEPLGLLRLADLDEASVGNTAWPERLRDPSTGWSLLRWAQRIRPDAVKPTASVLASFVPATGQAEPTPALLTMRFGAGRVMYSATDEIWRWRYARGEALPERFWIPLIRLLARERLSQTGRSVALEATPGDVELGESVLIELSLLDARLAEAAPTSIDVGITNEGGDLRTQARLRLDDARDGPPRYAAAWTPPALGDWTITANDPVLDGDRAEAGVRVFAADDERRQPETDHGLLASLAAETGGTVLSPDRLGSLSDLFPNRSRQIAGEPETDTLWDSPAALLVLIVLLGAEWIGRRLLRLA